jgi:hypothetical protein
MEVIDSTMGVSAGMALNWKNLVDFVLCGLAD